MRNERREMRNEKKKKRRKEEKKKRRKEEKKKRRKEGGYVLERKPCSQIMQAGLGEACIFL